MSPLDLPNAAATSVIVGLAVWVIRMMLQRSDREAREYRELLIKLIEETRAGMAAFAGRQGDTSTAIRDLAASQRQVSVEIHKLAAVTMRLERGLIRRGMIRDFGTDGGDDEVAPDLAHS